ncbi:LysR substrate-binding domain-containing protein [Acinetobacter sp. WZC-1]|uniref:LysR substrate-binding domain-containing protein n=1 Tax=Acinetobacter sp. WZC-1 TaxID=3459034 RepID=UPI00403E28BD
MDRLDCINAFVNVVETGNFSSAARTLNITRDLVAKRVAYLEHDLKVTLLVRTTRKMNLTPCGEKFYEHSKVILGEFDWAKHEIGYDQLYPEGELRINAPLSFSQTFLTSIISEFILHYPDIKVDLFLTDSFVDIYDSKFDLTLRVAENPVDAFENTIIGTYQRNFYATPAYFQKYGTPQTIDELKQHKLLLYRQTASHNKIFLSKADQTTSIQCFPKFTCNNGRLLLDMCIKDHGITFLPDFIAAKYLQTGLIVPCLEEYQSAPIYFYAAYPDKKKVPRKVQLFIDFLIAENRR